MLYGRKACLSVCFGNLASELRTPYVRAASRRGSLSDSLKETEKPFDARLLL